MTADLIFFLLAALTLVPAFWVVLSPNLVHAGFALLFTLMGVAGLFAWLGADFLAITQLMVYIGGVLVLILFTVMMTRLPDGKRSRHGLDRLVPPTFLGLAVFALLYKVITGTDWAAGTLSEAVPTTSLMGLNFMTNYIFPFEYVSLVLLAAMIGAAILVREAKNPAGDEADGDAPAGEDTEVTS